MKLQPSETMYSYNNDHIHQHFIHSMPKFFQFWMFLKYGVFNGKGTYKFSRVLCYFSKHKWGMHTYETYEDFKPYQNYKQCARCGLPSKKWKIIENQQNIFQV